jgi:hypothetical protein
LLLIKQQKWLSEFCVKIDRVDWNRIPEPGTTISGFADSKKKKKKINADRP